MKSIGNKIIIVGVSASGKSSFARKLSKKIAIPVTFMDEIMWNPDWNYIGDEATTVKLIEISKLDKWVIEGYISKAARTFLFERANTIIYLDYPRRVAAWRYLKRWWKHRKTPRPELEGCPEKFSFKFLKLVWTKGEAISLDKFLSEIKDQSKIIRFHSPNDSVKFLSNNF